MWIGIGVYALYEAFKSFGKKKEFWMGMIAGAGLLLFLILILGRNCSMHFLGSSLQCIARWEWNYELYAKVLKKDDQGAGVAISLFQFH